MEQIDGEEVDGDEDGREGSFPRALRGHPIIP